MSPFRGAEVSKIDVLLDASHDGGLHVCGPIGDPSHMHFAESVGSQVILLAPLEARATNTVYSIADPDALGDSETAAATTRSCWEMQFGRCVAGKKVHCTVPGTYTPGTNGIGLWEQAGVRGMAVRMRMLPLLSCRL